MVHGARWAGAVVTAGMVGAILYGFLAGSFGEEGGQILDLAWGRVTLIDLYLGLTLIGTWIAWRERSIARTFPWIVGLVGLGSLAAGAYVLLAALRSNSKEEFFFGSR
ncbi:MAG: DUF1475 family protein [Acidimicrobiia bacterium]|nr:DUF1475 family protein [Acidimicrobiia bacterium]